MQKRKLEPETLRCRCGRELTTATANVYHSHLNRYVFHRCECGLEWTERFEEVDRSEPISGDELLAVHQVLLGYEGRVPDLLQEAFA